MINNETLSIKIKNVREILRLTQKQFADLFGITQQHISEWELDKCTPGIHRVKLLLKLAKKAKIKITLDDFDSAIDYQNFHENDL